MSCLSISRQARMNASANERGPAVPARTWDLARWREDVVAAVEGSDLDLWLPQAFVQRRSSVGLAREQRRLVGCESLHRATDAGLRMIAVAAIGLDDGSMEAAAVSANASLVAGGSGDAVLVAVPERDQTRIVQLSIAEAAGRPTFVATGTVPGANVAVLPMSVGAGVPVAGASVGASAGPVAGCTAERARVSSPDAMGIAVSSAQRGQRARLPACSPVTRSVRPQPEQANVIMGVP